MKNSKNIYEKIKLNSIGHLKILEPFYFYDPKTAKQIQITGSKLIEKLNQLSAVEKLNEQI